MPMPRTGTVKALRNLKIDIYIEEGGTKTSFLFLLLAFCRVITKWRFCIPPHPDRLSKSGHNTRV
jgi:hypothetical protein